MNENLTVQAALAKLLAEKKSLLNDSKALMTALQEYVAPAYSMQLAFFRNALVEANIGEVLILSDGSNKDTRDRAKAEVMARLEKNNMQKERAMSVVQTLTEAMGWNQEPPPPPELPYSHNNDLKFFPVVDDYIQHSQQEIQIKASESVKTHLDTIDENDKADNKTEGKTDVDYYNDGLIALREKKYDKALENFNKAIEMNPAKRGMCYYELKKYRSMQTLLHQKLANAEGSKIDDEISDVPSDKTDNAASSRKITNAMSVAEIFLQKKNQATIGTVTKNGRTADKVKVKTVFDYYNSALIAMCDGKYNKALEDFNKERVGREYCYSFPP